MSEPRGTMEADEKRAQVREAYGAVARGGGSCCGAGEPGSGLGGQAKTNWKQSSGLGYTQEELEALPEGADLGLGCGSPVGKADPQPGEVVLDLGSGAGIDCFLAAKRVGPTGMALGVDMTPEMLARARENARKTSTANVEFRLGEIEHLPVETASVDVVISNCVLNLVPSKAQAFSEIARVLRPGGRLVVSDVVKLRDLPSHLTMDPALYCACLGGAIGKEEYLSLLA
ncbi:MAG TPA: arsenite methyltransferase, partial [Armatimonadota bacterium]